MRDVVVDVCGGDLQERRYARLVPPAWQDRVRFHGRLPQQEVAALLRAADVFCAPSIGPETAGVALLEAMASGAAVVASQIPGYDEVVQNEGTGLLVPPRDVPALAAALSRLLGDHELRRRLSAHALRASRRYDWERVTAEIVDVYEEVARRRRHPLPRRRRQQRELFADFHIHTHHSKDCVMPVADILERAREVGLDVVAITDHDSAAGGLEARELADRYGVRVIVGEEVKSSEGEIIGLFLERTIPGGMSFADTIAAIREQGGITYVPHPFDRLHTIPSPSVLQGQRRRHRRRGGLQLAAGVPGLQRARRALRPAVPAARRRRQRRARPARHRHLPVRHGRLHRAGRLRRGPRREPHRAPAAQPHLPAVAQAAADDDGGRVQGRYAGGFSCIARG